MNAEKYKTHFSIGELSKLFNIGVDSIRYYEEVGLLHPTRNPNNNYRMYTSEDIRRMSLIRGLLDLNFSTEQIRTFETDRTIKKTKKMFSDELMVVNDQIERLMKTRQNIQKRLENINYELACNYIFDEQPRLLYIDTRHCVTITDYNSSDYYIDFYLNRYMQTNNQRIDMIGTCDCYTLDLARSNPDSLYYCTKNVFFYSPNIKKEHSNYTLLKGHYLSLTYRGPLTKTKELVPSLFEYAAQHNMTVTDFPIEFCHIDDYETDYENEYIIELQLPVQITP